MSGGCLCRIRFDAQRHTTRGGDLRVLLPTRIGLRRVLSDAVNADQLPHAHRPDVFDQVQRDEGFAGFHARVNSESGPPQVVTDNTSTIYARLGQKPPSSAGPDGGGGRPPTLGGGGSCSIGGDAGGRYLLALLAGPAMLLVVARRRRRLARLQK